MQLRTFVWRIGSLTGTSDKLQFVMVPTKGSSRKYNEVFPDRANANHKDWLICYVTESWSAA